MRLLFTRFLLLLASSFLLLPVMAQSIRAELLQQPWKAFWISVPGEPAKSYGVYRFRKTMELRSVPDSFIVHVSADNRYKLLVNGKLVALGPARGERYHWNFETVNLSPFLVTGKNTVAALVWNDGEQKPEAQISLQTAFLLQGNGAAEEVLNTDKSWKASRDKSYTPLPPQLVYSYYVAGPGERKDNRLSEGDWTLPSFSDNLWTGAAELFHGLPKGVFDWTTGWMLVPRTIPPMELKEERLASVRASEGITPPAGFPQRAVSTVIPAHKKITLLLDLSYLTNGYPRLQFSGGKDAQLSLSYAEALYVDEGGGKDWRAQTRKGNRNEITGKRFVGKEDRVISNGEKGQVYIPLWWRTFRYLQLQVETAGEPLVLDDISNTFSGYPFRMEARFDGGGKGVDSILEVGWRTARLCAMETYMDCPYYEQLQYLGDTRIQALISYYNSGDDRLARNAIEQMDQSRMAEGITLSRYPTDNAQQIPPFSLWWIGMLHDYWQYRPDPGFVAQKLGGVRQVLSFFERQQGPGGLLQNPPYWNFTDWAEGPGWERGVAPTGANGQSAALDLQLLWAFQLASELETALGSLEFATRYHKAAERIRTSILAAYWDAGKGLFTDRPEKDLFSQHVNALAILTGTVPPEARATLAQKLLKDTALIPATVYFQYYIHQALIRSGLGNDYLNWLQTWKENLRYGLTTWAEISDLDRSRSDCHAWGAHPNIEFFRTVLGIDTEAPAFARVRIQPHLGTLRNVSGSIPHPKGTIKTLYTKKGNRWTVQIDLPEGVPGTFYWEGKKRELKGGGNSFTL